MGIDDLFDLVHRQSSRSLYLKRIQNFQNRVIGIDGSDLLYKAFIRYQGDMELITKYFIDTMQKLTCCNIKPIVIFDGKRHPIKAVEHAKRDQTKETIRQKLLDMEMDVVFQDESFLAALDSAHLIDPMSNPTSGTPAVDSASPEQKQGQVKGQGGQGQGQEQGQEQAKGQVQVQEQGQGHAQGQGQEQGKGQVQVQAQGQEQAQRQEEEQKHQQEEERLRKMTQYRCALMRASQSDKEHLCNVLNSTQVIAAIAQYEADSALSNMAQAGLFDTVASQDSDFLIYSGTRFLIRNLSDHLWKDKHLLVYDKENIYKDLKLSHEQQLFDLAILLGCDMVTKLKGIGVSKGLPMLIQAQRLEKIRHVDNTAKWLESVTIARSVFGGHYFGEINSELVQHAKNILARSV